MVRAHCSGVPFGEKSTWRISAADWTMAFSCWSSSGVTWPDAKRRLSSARWRPSIARMSTGSFSAANLLPLIDTRGFSPVATDQAALTAVSTAFPERGKLLKQLRVVSPLLPPG